MTRAEARLETGPWFEAGRPLPPLEADAHLAARYAGASSPVPYCVYVHVPYCSSLCSFCALYTHGLAGDAETVLDTCLESLQLQLARHPLRGTTRAPVTVHFGGGTPLCLGPRRLRALVANLRNSFCDDEACEWAVETTTSSIDPASLDLLSELGATRIHLGIQTLDDAIRQRIGRMESGETALQKIDACLQRKLAVSVDLIVGLDGATPEIAATDVERLYNAGVRMFSVCELRSRSQVPGEPSRRRDASAENYRAWSAIWNGLLERGLEPIHLGQFGRSQEDNLYFTHPSRGEDCIALGPSAHGSAGALYTANSLLPEYDEVLRAGSCPIAAATLYDERAEQVRDLERELLTHRVDRQRLSHVAASLPGFEALLASWLANGLLVDAPGKECVLSCEGSWFLGNLILQVRRLHETRRATSPLQGVPGR